MGRVGDRKPYEPVTWTNINAAGGRVFYTSLGHPDEFNMPFFRTLLVNGIHWALDMPIPSEEQVLDGLLPRIKKYEFGDSRRTLSYVADLVVLAKSQEEKTTLARRLGELLGPDSTFACKQFACQQLRLIGTAEQVPALAKMLTDERLANPARFALEHIRSKTADAALRDALGRAMGMARVGIINSLGNRRDAEAVPQLGQLLSDSDAECARAAAYALARIGTKDAAEQLRGVLAESSGSLRETLADAYVICADNLRAQGDIAAARKIYEELSGENWPDRIRAAAVAGLVAVGRIEPTEMLRHALSGDNVHLRVRALRYVRRDKTPGATQVFVSQLSSQPADGQVLLLNALADRADPAAMPAVLESLESPEQSVRVAALRAASALGEAGVVPALARFAATGEQAEQQAARESLNRLRGVDTDEAIASLLTDDNPAIRGEAARSLAARKATAAVGSLLRAAEDSDPAVRLECWRALRQLATGKDLAAMVELWFKTGMAGERKAAQDAVVAVARKIPQSSQRAKPLLEVIDSVKDSAMRASMLEALGRIGDPSALVVLRAGLRDKDGDVRTAAIRALGAWPNDEPIEELLAVAAGAQTQTDCVLALRGVAALLRRPGTRTVAEKLKIYKQAMGLAGRDEDRKLLLGALGGIADLAALKAVEPFLDNAQLKDEAAAAAARIAGWVAETNQIEDKANRRYVRAVMQKALSVAQSESVIEAAQEVLNQLDEKDSQ